MTKTKMVRLLAMPCAVVVLHSCVKAPVDLSLKDKIEIPESQVLEIAEDVFEKLAEIEFDNPPPPTIPAAECSTAYKVWLRKQMFDRGLVPNDLVTAAEYGESSNHPKILECRSIDFQKEYEDAVAKSVRDEKRKRKAIVFGVSKFRELLQSNRCSENFIDVDKEKITIRGIDLHVKVNTLTVKAPRYKLYSTYEDESLADEIESTKNAEDNLVNDGTLMLLGETRVIERRYIGQVPVDLNNNADAFFEAEGPVVSLDGTLFAVPSQIATEPELTKHNNREYFVVPSGRLVLTMSTKIELSLSTYDIKCAFDRFKETIRENEVKRQKEEEEQRQKDAEEEEARRKKAEEEEET